MSECPHCGGSLPHEDEASEFACRMLTRMLDGAQVTVLADGTTEIALPFSVEDVQAVFDEMEEPSS